MLIPQFIHFTVCMFVSALTIMHHKFPPLQLVSLKTMRSFILQEGFIPNFKNVKEEYMRLVHPGSRICNREKGWKNFSGEVSQQNNDCVMCLLIDTYWSYANCT